MRCTFYSSLIIAALFARDTKNIVEAIAVSVYIPEYLEDFEHTLAQLVTQRKTLSDDFAEEFLA